MAIRADALVQRTRELIQVVNPDALNFTDGFSDDPAPATGEYPIRILPAINEYVLSLAKLKYNCATANVGLTASQDTYSLPTSTHEVLSVHHAGIALTQTTRDAQDSNDVTWETQVNGVPVSYIKEGLDIILIPAPSADAVTLSANINVRIAAPETALTTESSTFSKFPDSLAPRIPYGAALIMMGIDAANPAHARRLALYASIAQSMEDDLTEIATQDRLDYATQISADNYEPVVGGRQLARGRPTAPTRPAGGG